MQRPRETRRRAVTRRLKRSQNPCSGPSGLYCAPARRTRCLNDKAVYAGNVAARGCCIIISFWTWSSADCVQPCASAVTCRRHLLFPSRCVCKSGGGVRLDVLVGPTFQGLPTTAKQTTQQARVGGHRAHPGRRPPKGGGGARQTRAAASPVSGPRAAAALGAPAACGVGLQKRVAAAAWRVGRQARGSKRF